MKKTIPNSAVLIPKVAQLAFKGEIFDVYQWQQELFDGSSATFEMLRRPDTVTVICVVDGKIIVLDEEQPNSGKRTSFPGGRVDLDDTSIRSAAEREVREEVGYSFQNWRLLQVSQPIKKMEWFVYVWLAWEPTAQVATAHDAGEKIEMGLYDFDEVKQMVSERQGIMDEAFDMFTSADSVDALMQLPEYVGRVVTESDLV